MKAISISLLLLILAGSCVKKVGNKDVSFKEQILPIFVTNCTMPECHNGQGKHERLNLTTYEGIMQIVVPRHPLLSQAYTTVNGNRPSMPARPYPKLSSKEVELIKLWINMGATDASVSMPCDSSNVTFSGSVEPIFKTWCVGCHSSTNPGKGIDLSTFEGVKACVNGGRLMGSIQHLSGYTAMPQNTNQLSDCDISKIAIWIRGGALSN